MNNDQVNQPPAMDIATQTTAMPPVHHESKSATLTLMLLIFLVVACLAAWLYLLKKPRMDHTKATPIQTLELLSAQSGADTTTVKEKAAALSELKAGSKPVGAQEKSVTVDSLNK